MNISIARETLSKLFGFDPSVLDCIDTSASALRITNLNEDVLLALSSRLSSLIPIQAVLPEENEERDLFNTNTTNSLTAKPYRSYHGPLASIMPSSGKLNCVKQEFLRILLECKGLIKSDGFCISTKKAGSQLGVSQQLISRYRKEFVQRGLLKPHKDRSFTPGKRAKRFIAVGDLASALKQLHPIKCEVIIPTAISDTKWNEALGNIVGKLHYTHSLEESLKKIRTIAGSRIGDRLKQAEGWYRWYARKRFPSANKTQSTTNFPIKRGA